MTEKRSVGRPKAQKTKEGKVKTRLSDAQQSPTTDVVPAKRRLSKYDAEEQDDAGVHTNVPTCLLPNRIYESRPLPSLDDLQSADLIDSEYQSILSSGVLQSSLLRSRQKWLAGDYFETYWSKPTTRSKESKGGTQINNPQKSWMKEIGPCIVIVEPLIFEVTAFYSREPNLVLAAQQQQKDVNQQIQQTSSTASPYGSPYNPRPMYNNGTQAPVQHQQQPRQMPSPVQIQAFGATSAGTAANTVPPNQGVIIDGHANVTPSQPVMGSPAPAATSKNNKASPDPVIQMLATRASSDRELKELMKVVATGNANQDQLRAFQKHIDDLTAIIQSQRTQGPSPVVNGTATSASFPQSNASSPFAQPQLQQQRPPPPQLPRPAPQHVRSAQQSPAPQRKANITPNFPVVLEFNSPEATSDRFLFPPYSVIEPLGSYSILASFLVFRKGSEAGDPTIFDADMEYYEPVTVKIDVEPRYRDILEYMKRCVKPQQEVKAWMEDQLRRRKRASMRFLPLRLPVKNQLPESEELADELPVAAEVKKPRPYVKKEKMAKRSDDVTTDKSQFNGSDETGKNQKDMTRSNDDMKTASEVVKVEEPPEELGRGKRQTRKSARFMES